ncbi:MAG TPA: acyl-CoA dehydrogenase family protein [Mycobacteriales bacterium]|nr:acyl-CoA dehydrogenase family protein [Mycobacteriales bacterium]
MTVTAGEVLELDAYRDGVRSWLRGSADVLEPFTAHPFDRVALLAQHQRLTRVLWDAGWKRYGWPTSVGGYGGGVLHRAVLYDELAIAGIPLAETDYFLEVMGDPTLHFAPDIAHELLPAVLRGDAMWAQGFSEPGAGSDLAALRTRAARDGDGPEADYVVNGHKLWTSSGFAADWFFTLVRTGTPESRHRGITALMIDAHAPGVTTRPLVFASGTWEMSESFFDDVRVPASMRIGPHDGGWGVAMHLLQYERGMYAWMRQAWLFAQLRALGGSADPSDTAAADAIGRAYHAVSALRARSLTTVRRLAAGETVGPDASADKVLLAAAEQLTLDVVRQLRFPAFELGASEHHDVLRAEWWFTRASSIYGGSGEVQRGILADRVLHLPAES